MKALTVACAMLLLLVGRPSPAAADTRDVIMSLKQGGYVLVFRHGATDESQKDVYPFKFDDMKAQRQLNNQGRDVARQIGAAMKKLGIPVGDVYTSQLNRAVETGKLISDNGKVKPVDALTDSSAGSTTGMANPNGGNTKAGTALRDLVNTAPAAGTNTLLVTHKTNITDGFGKEASDVQEGESFVYKPNGSGPATLVARIKAAEWAQAAQ